MPAHNSHIANQFRQIADLLELKEANPFRVRSYREAARVVGALPRPVEDMLDDGEDLSELPGIGDDLSQKIETLVRDGELKQLTKLRDEVGAGLLKVLDVPGLGPKRTRQLADELGIENLEDLLQAAKNGAIRDLDGFGEKTEAEILRQAKRIREQPERLRYADAEEMINPLVDCLAEQSGVGELTVAGSVRRCRQTVGDIDILVTSNANTKVMEAFVAYEDVDEIISQGTTRSSVRLTTGLQVDLRVVAKKSYGAALQYFTGNKAHNIKLRKMAQHRGWKMNEYGIFDGDTVIAGTTEKEIYEALDLILIPPELREDRGEIEAAKDDALPKLVRLEQIRGDLHAHTKASDGHETMKDMIAAARERGYEYLSITDHSEHLGVTQGLDAKGVEKQRQAIRSRSDDLDDFDLLAGIEVDILDDGKLALPDSVLKELDLVIASVHTRFGLSRKKQTRRILKAMEHECLHALGHPTGRMLGKRDGYEVDLDALIKEAADGNWAFELNANPLRLDLDDIHCKQAREHGVKIMLGTDAHRRGDLRHMRHGIGQARRGWLESKDVLNTRTWKQLRQLIDRS